MHSLKAIQALSSSSSESESENGTYNWEGNRHCVEISGAKYFRKSTFHININKTLML